jgi:hypothetical protein
MDFEDLAKNMKEILKWPAKTFPGIGIRMKKIMLSISEKKKGTHHRSAKETSWANLGESPVCCAVDECYQY